MEGLALLFILSLFAPLNAVLTNRIGINYGMLGNDLPSRSQSIEHIKSLRAGRVKLYNADPEVLRLLSGTRIQVTIMIPNNLISRIALGRRYADAWVAKNVVPYYPNTTIRFVLVGNEVLSYNDSVLERRQWHGLVPAMKNVRASLKAHRFHKIKVSTALAMDVVELPFPPSSGRFRQDISDSVMGPLLRFLSSSRSYFFLDVYPYFPWSANPGNISLGYALLQDNFRYTDPVNGLVYTNMLDQMLDSVIFAMARLKFTNIPLFISETGWPNEGDHDQPGANIHNAATYNSNLIRKITARPPPGTPARPRVTIPTFLFSLYNENQKAGPTTERHWGLLYPNGTAIYSIDLSGKRPVSIKNSTEMGKL